MKIYKLNDEVLEEPRRNIDDNIVNDSDAEKGGKRFEITDLKQGVKNPNRVNVFINGRFSFSLDVAQVVDLGVKTGQVLSSERLPEHFFQID